MQVKVLNLSSPDRVLHARVLRTPWARARGYLFHRPPRPHEGLLFLYRRPARRTVHMFGVPFPLDVAWLDEAGRVIEVRHLAPWLGFTVSPVPVKAFLECSPEHGILPGDRLEWEPL